MLSSGFQAVLVTDRVIEETTVLSVLSCKRQVGGNFHDLITSRSLEVK